MQACNDIVAGLLKFFKHIYDVQLIILPTVTQLQSSDSVRLVWCMMAMKSELYLSDGVYMPID